MSVWQDLWGSFRAVFGPVATVAALGLAVWGELYAPAAAVQLSVVWVVIAAIVTTTALLTSWQMVATARRHAGHRLPRALAAVMVEKRLTLLLEPSDLFALNTLVAIYYTQAIGGDAGIFERAIGFGKVSNIQEDRHIQIAVVKELVSDSELWELIRTRDQTPLRHIVIKPSVRYDWDEEG